MRYALSMILLLDLASIGAFAQIQDAQSRYTPFGAPPAQGYESYDDAVRNQRTQTVIANVPAYLWRYGCGPTAAGMVIGYWDGYDCPLLIPGDASIQTPEVNQAIAGTEHYDDYSVPIDSPPDPIELDKSTLGGRTRHTTA